MTWQVYGYLIPLNYRVTTAYLMGSLGWEKAYIFLIEVIGDTRQEYTLIVDFIELMNGGSDSNDPIYFGHVFNRNIALHIVY